MNRDRTQKFFLESGKNPENGQEVKSISLVAPEFTPTQLRVRFSAPRGTETKRKLFDFLASRQDQECSYKHADANTFIIEGGAGADNQKMFPLAAKALKAISQLTQPGEGGYTLDDLLSEKAPVVQQPSLGRARHPTPSLSEEAIKSLVTEVLEVATTISKEDREKAAEILSEILAEKPRPAINGDPISQRGTAKDTLLTIVAQAVQLVQPDMQGPHDISLTRRYLTKAVFDSLDNAYQAATIPAHTR